MDTERKRPTPEEIVEKAKRGFIDDYDDAYPLTPAELFGSAERAALIELLIYMRQRGDVVAARDAAKDWLCQHPDDSLILAALEELIQIEKTATAR